MKYLSPFVESCSSHIRTCAQLSCQYIFARSFDPNIYVQQWFIKISLLPSHMLHIATCVFIIRWHGDRVIVALFHFCQNNTSLLIHNQIRVSSIGKRMLKKLHVLQTDPSTNPKTIKSKKSTTVELLTTCTLLPRSGYEWPCEEIWRDFGFTFTSKAPSIYFTPLSIQHTKSIPTFLKAPDLYFLSHNVKENPH